MGDIPVMLSIKVNPQFSRHYDNNAVNNGQHYFHNDDLSDIHGIFPIIARIKFNARNDNHDQQVYSVLFQVSLSNVFWVGI